MPIVYSQKEWKKTAKQMERQRQTRAKSDTICSFCGYRWKRRVNAKENMCPVCKQATAMNWDIEEIKEEMK